MIVINPPAVPANVPNITSTRAEEAAVEWALSIARARYSCEGNAGAVDWLRCLSRWGVQSTFVIHGTPSFALAVYAEGEVAPEDRDKHLIVDGLDGVIEVAAMVRQCLEGQRAAA